MFNEYESVLLLDETKKKVEKRKKSMSMEILVHAFKFEALSLNFSRGVSSDWKLSFTQEVM